MATLLVGDFRSLPIQHYYNRLLLEAERTKTDKKTEKTEATESANDSSAFTYLLEDTAEYSWFEKSVVEQLPAMSINGTGNHVIIALGFNDCVYSCIWSNFNINTLAKNYVKSINELVSSYASVNFYVCSVGPIESDYAFSEYKDTVIPKNVLLDKIKKFNKVLEQDCEATFIDCYTYLSDTSFKTYDGVRYMQDTCLNIANYITGSLKNTSIATSNANFTPRLVSPRVDNDVENDKYWLRTSHGGLNPFPLPGTSGIAGDTLPNCTAYAWGRFYEIIGSKPKLSTGNAEQWFLKTSDGYERGQTPALGAVICWQKGATTNPDGDDGAGHVAIVEQINSDGSIVTSESGWKSSSYWWTTTRRNDDGNWNGGSGYKFQGFIYCPAVTASPNAVVSDNVVTSDNAEINGDSIAISKADVINKDNYLTESEMKINARYIWNYLGTRGWTLNAVAAMLGNMQSESNINPGLRERGGGTGYGLVQWTPGTNHINWAKDRGYAKDDIDGQLEHIIWERDNGKQYYKNRFKYTFKEFAVSTDDPYILAAAFLCDYERAADTGPSKQDLRGKQAVKWYEYLLPYAPGAMGAEKFVFDNLTIDKLNTTNISASFIVRNGKKCKYKLYKGNDVIASKSLKVDFEKEEKKASEAGEDIKKLHTINFIIESLIPNTDYKLFIEITSSLGDEKRETEVEFKTPQAYPDNVKSIHLSCKTKIVTADSLFGFKVDKPDELGYWKKNSSGYTRYLFVNNNCVYNTDISSTKNIDESFNIKSKFKYEVKTGDIVQIGLRTWVKDDNGTKIYNKNGIKASEAICLLNNPLRIYLNK